MCSESADTLQLGFASGLTGEVPSTVGRMQQLGYLDIAGNMLTGSLPGVTANQMINLRLAENFLTGTIPASYGAQSAIWRLRLCLMPAWHGPQDFALKIGSDRKNEVRCRPHGEPGVYGA